MITNTELINADDRQKLLTKNQNYCSINSLQSDWSSGSKKVSKKKENSKYFSLFTFASWLDYVLFVIGIASSIFHGAGFPLLSIVLGQMTSVFLRAQNSDFVNHDIEYWGINNYANDSLDLLPKQITQEEFTNNVTKFSIYYLLLGVAMFVTSYIQIAIFESLAEKIVNTIRQSYFRAILRQDICWFDSMQTGNLTSRLTDDLERVREGIGDKVSIFIQMVSAFISSFIVGFIYSWQMTLVMLIFTPALAYTGALMGRIMSKRTQIEQEKYAVANAIAEETFSSMRTVLSLNGQKQEIKRYEIALENARKTGLSKYLYLALGLGANFIISFTSQGIAFWFASRLIVWYPNFDRGAVFTVFFSVMNGSTALGNALPNLASMGSARGALRYVLDVLNNQPKIDPYSNKGKLIDSENNIGEITFKNVHFSYPLRNSIKILNDVSLSVRSGQRLALVGSSGCGKSTIINLLLRFYDPDEGVILLNGIDLRKLNVKSLRDNIGVVSQEPILFDGTLEENIMLGNEFATREDVNRCCKMANAYNFINNLPDGLYTRVGERGVQLSGGQKQRIAIARALIRNPKILLLDEATSALDTESEAIVQEALDKAQEGRTTIIVAHRLATIRNVDKILVFKNGKIIETGTHKELYNMKGVFYNMVNAQQLEKKLEEKKLKTIEGKILLYLLIKNSDYNEESDQDENNQIKNEKSLLLPLEDKNKTKSIKMFSSKKSLNEKHKESLSSLTMSNKRKYTHSSNGSIHSEFLRFREMEDDMKKSKLKPTTLMQIFKFNQSSWHFFFFGLIGCIISGSLVPLFSIIYSQIFAVFSEPINELEKDSIFWASMFVVFGFLNAFGFFISANCLGRCGESLTKKLRFDAFYNLLRQDIGFYDDPRHNTGKLCTRFATDAPNVRYVFTRLPSVISAFVTLIGAVIVGFLNGWKLSLVLFTLIPLMILSGYFEMKLHFGNQMRNTELLENAGKVASEAVDNIRTVAGLNKQLIFHKKYCHNLILPFRTNLYQAQIYGLIYGFSQSLIFFMYALAFFIGSLFILDKSMTPISVFRVFFAIAFCGQSIGQMSGFIPDVVKARVAASLLFYLINYPTKIDSLSTVGISKKIKGNIELKNVHFSYPTRKKIRILNNLNLNVKKGETIALVGYSGCGKSTIISLLERFYNLNRGSIIIDGVNIADYNIQKLREQICIVSQEPILFDTTISKNICYGIDCDSHVVSYEKIVAAAKQANIHNFILSQPEGYETKVGSKGTQLSGGQKQRIAIARALIRHPSVLLLDEATSALDTESEQIVQEALENARKGRTCIIIAHRLSTIQNADKIVVINDGHVVQTGTHDELLKEQGIYQSLCQTQFLNNNDSNLNN